MKSNIFHSLLIILFLLLFVYAFCFVSEQLYLMVYDGNIILKVKEREYKTRSEIFTIYCMHFGVSQSQVQCSPSCEISLQQTDGVHLSQPGCLLSPFTLCLTMCQKVQPTENFKYTPMFQIYKYVYFTCLGIKLQSIKLC